MNRASSLRRPRRRIVTVLGSAGVLLAACGGGPHAGLTSTTTTSGPSSTGSTGRGPGTTAPAGHSPPSVLVAVTASGALVRLDPATGSMTSTLVPGNVVGDEVAVSPDGSSVYFEEDKGCDHQIWRVATTGGDPSVVAPQGSLPAISPTGNILAYAQQPLAYTAGCAPTGADNGAGLWKVVVDNLSTNLVRDLPMAPEAVASGLPFPISHLSWSSDGNQIAVSISAPEDNEGWALDLVDPVNSEYYFGGLTPSVPLPAGQTAAGWYWRQGVFQPDGNLFVVKQCCAGLPEKTTSVELDQVSPSTGTTLHTVAIGLTDVAHTSLSVDSTGRWLLYLSGGNLEVSHDGARPVQVASGLLAAAW